MAAADILVALLQASWQASVGIVLLLAVRALAGRFVSGWWLYVLWLLVMVRLLVPGSILPVSPAPLPRPAALVQVREQMQAEPVELTPVVAVAETVTQRGGQEIHVRTEVRKARPLSWQQVLVIVWASGAGLLAMYFLGAAVWLDRRIRRGERPTPQAVAQWWAECRGHIPAGRLRLVTSDAVKAPLLFGLLRPRLVLPCGQLDGLSRADWEHIFLHELMHLRQRDNWTNLLPLAALCVHWFNPLVWLSQRAIRADRELAIDERVLGFLGEERGEDYARTLLRVLTSGGDSRLLPGAIGIVESGAGMKRRFRRIVELRAPRLAVMALGGAALCALALVAFGQEGKPEAKGKPDEQISLASMQDIKAQILAAARAGDAVKIVKIQEVAGDRQMPFRKEDASDLLEQLMAEGDVPTFTILLETLRKSHAGIEWQPGAEALTGLVKRDRRDFLEALFSHRVKLDLFTPEVMQAAGASQPWLEKRVAEVRQQRTNVDLLVQASKTGDIAEMTRLLDAGVDVDGVASDDFTPLTRAAVSGQAAAVKLLLARGAQVDKPRLPGWDYTAMCLAKTVEVAQLLKDAGANVNATLFGRPEPIVTYPARWASVDVVRWFLDNGVDAKTAHYDDPSLLFSAGRPETAELLIERGVPVNAREESGEAALTWILRFVKNPAQIAKVLLRHGADPNARSRGGVVPLMVAPDGETVDALIAAGADILAKDDRGGSVLQYFGGEKADPSREEALRRHGLVLTDEAEGLALMGRAILGNDVDQVKRLLAQGVNPDREVIGYQQYLESSKMELATSFGRFEIVNVMRAAGGKDVGLLSQAAAEGDIAKIKELLAAGAKVDETTSMGATPLSFAVRRGQLESVRVLLDAGADPAHFGRMGFTPMSYAEFMVTQWENQGSNTVQQTNLSPEDEKAFWSQAVALMEPRYPKAEPVDASGDTALTMASTCGNFLPVHPLLRRGANINHQRPDGMTPLMIAIVTKPKNARRDMVTSYDPKTGEKKQSSIAANYVGSLLEVGADVTLRNREGKTALDLARERNDDEIVALLTAPRDPAPTKNP
ncbi:M56 family metallopeptidase [Terrimicrobium sacchariphilum]|uniref:M56 family metallopeptidase n=1 Tax=Terrimicrobium sacchariphilum TaxID=690879 RepID=UPI00147225C5|nr:M56 family metallopeptidase [Terrimicrobium sacchariphilum]